MASILITLLLITQLFSLIGAFCRPAIAIHRSTSHGFVFYQRLEGNLLWNVVGDGDKDESIIDVEIVDGISENAVDKIEQDGGGKVPPQIKKDDEDWGETAINLMNVAILGYFLGIVVDILWHTLKARGFRLFL